ncbi:MAG: DUF3794 domain-containing protein [Clostridiales bacterium]|nr:DUF3794 domain-containing protein [Clostridiales bacterium]
MATVELIKENIEYEQLLGENFSDTVIKGEYLIPDTHPDVVKILMVDVKPSVISKETMQDKVYVEGQVFYNVIYLAKEEEGLGVYNVNYTDSFSNYVDIPNAEHKMFCEAECYVEHMDSNLINERKVGISGIIKIKASVYKNYNFEVVKSMDKDDDVQMLKYPTVVDKVLGNSFTDLVVKTQIRIPMDKPQVGKVLKCDVNLHKKEVKLGEGRIQVSAFANVKLMYRGKGEKTLVCLEDDVFISKELELEGVLPSMVAFVDFKVESMDYDIKEDDLGEDRIVDIEAIANAVVKVQYKEEIDMIEDAYSPKVVMDMIRKTYNLNVLQGTNHAETIVKENIEAESSPANIIMSQGDVMVTDKKIVEDKVMIDGIVKVDILFSTNSEEEEFSTISEELPFSCSVDIEGSKIDMECMAKANLENLEASVEANTIAVKAVVNVEARVNYSIEKDFLVDIAVADEEVPLKKASVTIYVVQPGDTLWKIAKRYYTTIDEIVRVNNIENPDLIYPNDKLIIPGRAIV